MHNYEYANKHFPLPASRSPDGKPLLSWRVHILPYLGQIRSTSSSTSTSPGTVRTTAR